MSLDIEGLRVRRGEFELDISAQIPSSGVTVLFGPSGAGKSLLLSAIAGLVRPAEGRISFEANVFEDASQRLHRPAHQRRLGMLFQDARLFPHLTVRGNLDYARRRAPSGAVLEAFLSELDIDSLLDRQVRDLSGGEKSRVALARALLSSPSLLLLDEPFAALDSRRRRALLGLLHRISRTANLPMLIVTHLVEDAAEIADQVVAIRAGRVVAEGPAGKAMIDPAFLALLDPRDVGARVDPEAVGLRDCAGVWVRADSVLVAGEVPRALSARHVWKGETAALDQEEGASVRVAIDTQVGRIFARITAQSAAELQLAPGRPVWAIVKTHAL